MAAGSEQFTWHKWWPWERACSLCGRELRVADVGEVRQLINEDGTAGPRFIWCNEHRGGRS